MKLPGQTLALAGMLSLSTEVFAFQPPANPRLPNFDNRTVAVVDESAAPSGKAAAVAELRKQLPNVKVDFHAVSRAPKVISNRDGFLSGPGGSGGAISGSSLAAISVKDPHRITKAFIREHSKLFGHGPEALEQARIKREFVSAQSGMRTVAWEQQVDEVPVFEGVLISHITSKGELVNVASQFIPDPQSAADRGAANRAALLRTPVVSAAQAVTAAARNAGEVADSNSLNSFGTSVNAEKAEKFVAPFLLGEAEAKLIWLPMDEATLRLCWDVTFTSKRRGEMFRILVDAQTGAVQVRHCLTDYLTDASYRVFTSDSPSPLSPGYSSPVSTQPALVSRSLVVLPALNTNASPLGWINDGGNETLGNNVDAHTDTNNDNLPDLPRPQGSPARVFDFAMDLTTQNPGAYSQAAVVQLFYWNNFMHDKLYELGFTEAAGNFQSNNFGRGGLGNDAVQADAQDGGGFNNANFSTPSDGSPGRMQMYVFNGSSPQRDGDLDAEIVLHEYTHGLSNRRVGGGVGISALQPSGMGEGWSDFYGLSLLSEAGDDVNGVYAAGAYATYQLSGMTQNYYYGIRRYPYCTDMTKNPLTFKDIDPSQASAHTGIPRSSIIGTTADEVHNMGEVWCVTLWGVRANLINKYGWALGNQRMLQLVTDGMNLAPANPTFLQARDAIIQADVVDYAGANRAQLWTAFARRGMGLSATSPSSSSTSGLVEAYDVPDDFQISPTVLSASGPVGGPFTPNPATFILQNMGTNTLAWSLAASGGWFTISPTSGTLAGGAGTTVSVTISETATNFSLGSTNSVIWFTNLASGIAQSRTFSLSVVGRSLFENFEPDIHLSLWSGFGGTLGSTIIATNYGGSISGVNSLWLGDAGTRFATTIPVNTSAGGSLSFYLHLGNGGAAPWEMVDIPGEGIALEYSTNSGVAWTLMGTYDTSTYYSWTQVTTNIPAGALSPATQFRWRQLSHSGTCCDHWALDDISIDAGPTPPSILTQPASQTVKSGSNVTFTVSAQGSFPLNYRWRRNGTNLLDGGRISGATNATLNISTLLEADSGQYLVVITNTYGSVTSTIATLLVTPLDHFEWSAISSPQAVGAPFAATIAARDSVNAMVTNFNGTVALSGSANGGRATNTILGDLVYQTTGSGLYTMGFAFTPNTNILVTHVRSYSGTKVSIWQTNRTLVTSQNVTSVPGTWVETPLSTPVTLTAGTTYIVAFYTGGGTYYIRNDLTNSFPNGTVVTAYYYDSTDGFPSNVVASQTVFLVDLRYTVNAGPPIVVAPASSGPFTNGIWSGLVTVQGPATNLLLRADDGSGHSGLSNPFNVLLQNDMSISMADSPDPVTVGANLTYSIVVANAGPSAGTAVTVTNVLPPGVNFVSATSSQGSCTQSAGVVRCNLGTVAGGNNATVTIVVTPTGPTILTNTATVSRAEVDPYPPNNSATSITTVLAPALSIADAAVIEGNSGQTNMIFAVQLSPASPLTVTVGYSTSNGTAQGGSDYVGTNGMLTFAPGETNHVVTVAVLGDTNSESSETFFVNLATPTNGILARAQATGIIFDDDSITVAVFDNATYVDTTSGGVSAESDNVQASLTNRNFRVVTFTSITAAASVNNVLLFPEFELRSLALDLTLAERGALSNFVANGGLMIVNGQGANAGAFINAVFGFAVAESAQSGGGTVYTRMAAAAGTHFGDDPVTITGNNGQVTLGLSSLPAGSLSIYEASGQSAVAEIPFGGGKIIYLGWDWYNAFPIGTQDGGWLTVLESSVLELGPTPLAIFSQPPSQTVKSGTNVSFTVSAQGSRPLAYQWRKNGTNLSDDGRISGAAAATLSISTVLESDSGQYSVVITNNSGSVTSSNATLLVTPLDHFAWSVISSPQAAAVPFAATIIAQDFLNATVTNFSGTVNLNGSAGGGQTTNSILGGPAFTGSSSGAFTLGYSFTPNTNLTVTHVRHYSGTKVSIWTDAGVLLAAQNVTSIPGTWTETALASPLQLTAGVTYRIAAYSGGGSYYWRSDLASTFPNGLMGQSYEASGDAFPVTTDSTRWWFVDLRYSAGSSIPISLTPVVTGAFTNGIWSGNLTAQQLATNAVLLAADGTGHTGTSNPFQVVATNDIALTMNASPAPVSAGANLTYVLMITNTGPAAASSVRVTNVLPAGVTFVSATASQGTATQNSGTVSCTLGTLPGATNASVTIVVVPTIAGTYITNVATVTRGEADGYAGNNSAAAITLVTTPAISISDASVAEGDAGSTNMLFSVTLAASSAQTITVNYATSDGTAIAGSDYVGTNGSLSFPPGTTIIPITVSIRGDKTIESNETFSVTLSNPINGVLGRTVAVGTILNDDGLPGLVEHFAWNTVASPQAVGVPFSLSITAKDFFNNTVTNFNGTTAQSGSAGGGQVTNNILAGAAFTSSSSGDFTLGYSFTPNTNLTVTHVRHYSGTKISIWTDTGVLLAAQNVISTPGTWAETALATPLQLTAGVTYRVAAYTGGGSSLYYWRNDLGSTFPNGVITQSYEGSGDIFPATSDTFRWWFVDLRYSVGSSIAVPITPLVTGAFTNGIWTGNVSVQQLATNVVLIADDGAGHAGSSNPFDLVLQNDLALTMSDAPDPVSVGANLTYTLSVTNTGPAAATSVLLTNYLPANVTFVSATVSQGTYTQSGGVVICNLGTVPGATNASVSIVVVPTISGLLLTNTATVFRAEAESYLSNNVATALTTVTLPAVSVADAAVVEGNIGSTNMSFAVTLNVRSAQTITVNYATANGTALAGSDYTSTNGIVTFAPGITNQSVLVRVTGDVAIESNETLFVNLSNPANVVLGRSQGTGTITNDDGLPGQIDHFAWAPVGSPQLINSSFIAAITALDASNTVVTNFSGPVTLSAAAPITPTVSGIFSNGLWTGGMAVQAFATNLVLRADDGDGHIGFSNPFHVITSNQPPVVIASPTNTSAYLGSTAAFQVNILGSVPLFYQWRLNGGDIPGETNTTLNLNRVTLGQGGSYSVVAWNAFGTNSSAKATLSVLQVVAWGAGTNNTTVNSNYGQAIVPAGLSNAIQLSGGQFHSLAGRADGKVSAWGAGTNTTQSSPQYGQSVVPPLGSVVAVAGGGYHSLALRGDGSLAAWGAGLTNILSLPNYGQCIVPALATNIVAIAAGDYHSVALRNDGRVLVWGYNGFQQTNVPTAATSSVVAIASRGSHVLALKSDGSLVHWGSFSTLPFGVSNIVTIAAGVNHCLALKSDGTVVSWGSQVTVPVGLSNVVDVAAGSDHNLALRSDGTVVTWGTTNLYGRYLVPAGLSNFVGIACGYYHSMGALGDGSPVIKWQPVSRSALLSTPVSFFVLGVGSQLAYQWQLNGTNIPGATNFTYTIPGAQALHAGNYQVVLANSFGAVTSAVASLTVLAPIGGALDAPTLSWSTSGNAAWFGETTISHDGIDAAQSGRIIDSQQSTVQASVSGPGLLNFWWKVSSEQYFDFLNFFVDGTQPASISGEVDWQSQTFAIGAGIHTLRWTYQKDSSVSAGLDTAWLDQVAYTTNPPVITVQPISQTNSMSATFSLSVSASGAPPLTYQWLKAGTNVGGAVSSDFSIINATRRDSATYSVVASNPGGSASSSNAVVLIRVPQRLNALVPSNGTFVLTSGDADGGLLSPEDLGKFDWQASSDLVVWSPLTDAPVLTNGTLLLIDRDSTNFSKRFYRVIEH